MNVSSEEAERCMNKMPHKKLGGWVNQTPARVLFELRFYNPIETLRKQYRHILLTIQQNSASSKSNQESPKAANASSVIDVPVFFIGATLDVLCPPNLIHQASALVPNSKLVIREGTHFQIYDPENYQVMATEMIAFYQTTCLQKKISP